MRGVNKELKMPKTLYKQYIAKVEVDDDEHTVTAVISTDVVDRDNEVMKPNGANLENFMKNPVVLWAHNYTEPSIGKALWVKTTRKHITAKTKFADTPRAEEIYQLYRGGYLKAFSIGFIPTESHKPEPKEIEKRPELAKARLIIDKWELLEYSPVPVPSNPEALATAVKTKEITVSKELQAELGLDDEETFYPASEEKLESVLKPEEKNSDEVCVIKAKKHLKLKKSLRGRLHVHIDPRECAEYLIKILKGRMS